MKKLIALILVGLLAGSMLGGSATAKKKKKKSVKQTESGTIVLPAVFPADMSGCYSGLHRRIAVATGGEQHNGVVGYSFDIDKRTWKKPFKLVVEEGQGDVDLDIHFYSEFGTVEQATDPAYAPPAFAYETRKPGGEKGKVPEDMERAIVCIYGGDPGSGPTGGAQATFQYVAGK
jgi:hypothetical protein